MYREPRKLSHVRKCMFCRRDKRKCLPTDRVWPGQKCEACQRYGYDCGAGLSAKEQAKIRSGAVFEAPPSQSVVPRTSIAQQNNTHDIPEDHHIEETRANTNRGPGRNPLSNGGSPSTPTYAQAFRQPNLRLIEPSNPRLGDMNTARLNDRLCRFWANPEIYDRICSPRLGRTMSDLFFYNFRQIAASEDMVHSALFAFCAVDDAFNVEYSKKAAADQLTYSYFSKAVRLLSARMEAHAAGDRRTSNVPLLFTVFLLAIYGTTGDDRDTIKLMTRLLDDVRQTSAVFPLGMEYYELEPFGWRVRVYLPDDPTDPGLTFGYDTSMFEQPRLEYERQLALEVEGERIVDVTTQES